jgi:hypothetical protein
MTLNDVVLSTGLEPDAIRSLLNQKGTKLEDIVEAWALPNYKAGKAVDRTVETDLSEEEYNALGDAEDEENEEDTIAPPVQPIGVPRKRTPVASVLPAVLPAPVATPKKRGRPKKTVGFAANMITNGRVSVPVTPRTVPLPNGMRLNTQSVYRSQVAKVQAAIQYLRQFNTPSPKGITSKGIHVVYSHFNEIMPAKLGVSNSEPTWELRALLTLMAQRGDIGLEPRRGGPMIYLPGESPARSGVSLADATAALANL